MNKRFPIVLSVGLILTGLVTLTFSVLGPLFGFQIWQLWPLFVIAAGLGFVVPPLLVRTKRGLGGLFIPGVPVLTTGLLLLFASVFRAWNVWAWLWPLEVISVGLGFLFAALTMRVIWLLIPAIIIGVNGLLIQFCAFTGWWGVWSVLWIIEPLSVGLALFIIHLQQRSQGLRHAAIALFVFAGVGFVESLAMVALSTIFPVWWVWRWSAPFTMIVLGIALLVLGVNRRGPEPRLAVE